MQTVKKTKDYTIFKKNSGRYCVQDSARKWIKAEDKIKILVGEKLIKLSPAKPKEVPQEEAKESAESPKEEKKDA